MNNFFSKISHKFNIILKLFRVLSYSDRIKFFYLFFLLLIGVFFEALSIGLIIPLLILLTNSNSESFEFVEYFFNHFTFFNNIYVILITIFFVYLIKSIYLSYLVWKKTDFCYNIHRDISKRLFRLYLFLPLSFHLNRNSSILIRNIFEEVSSLVEGFVSILQILTETTVLIGIVTLLILIEPTGSLAVFFIILTFVLTFHQFTKKRIAKWGRERQFHAGQGMKNLQQGFGAIKEIKLMQNQNFFLQRFYFNTSKKVEIYKKMIFIGAMPRLWLEVVSVLGVLILITTLLYNEKELIEIIPIIGLFAGAAFRVLPSVSTTVHYVQNFVFCIAGIERIYEEIKLPEKYDINYNITPKNEKINFNKIIIFKQITFIYEKNIEPTLKNISFDFSKGMKIGIIGESGVGKSTLINIFLGLLKPSSGEILVDGVNVSDNLDGWYNMIGYVPQNIYLTDDTLKRNIAFGISDDKIDNNRLKEVVKMSNIDKFILSLPKGLDTTLGERGIRLSGGQLQRIGIARALYRNPKILVLDEATSSLDVENEKEIIDTLDNLKGEITVIVISHRLSATKNCDKLFLIKNKNIELINNRE